MFGQEVFTVVEQMPEYPGGPKEMASFIRNNVSYPQKMRELGIGGKALLKFIVNEEGRISSSEIIRSAGVPQLDEEALRVVNSMPAWKPATQDGKKVKCYFNLPITFGLDEPYIIFNNTNTEENYLKAKEAVISGNQKLALELYSKVPADVDALYNVAVIYYQKGNKIESKRYFETVKESAPKGSTLFTLTEKFLTNYFN